MKAKSEDEFFGNTMFICIKAGLIKYSGSAL